MSNYTTEGLNVDCRARKWAKTGCFAMLTISLFLFPLIFGCSTIKYLPVETVKEVHVHDTTYLRDTTIKYQIEKERYTEYAGLLDTLKLSTAYASAEAYIDTTANMLKGSIKSKPEKEIQIKWKERTVYRDSIVYKEKPYPVEVIKEVKHTPFLTKVLAWIGGIGLVLAVIYILIRFGIFKI